MYVVLHEHVWLLLIFLVLKNEFGVIYAGVGSQVRIVVTFWLWYISFYNAGRPGYPISVGVQIERAERFKLACHWLLNFIILLSLSQRLVCFGEYWVVGELTKLIINTLYLSSHGQLLGARFPRRCIWADFTSVRVGIVGYLAELQLEWLLISKPLAPIQRWLTSLLLRSVA